MQRDRNVAEPKDESFYRNTRPIPGFTGYRIDRTGKVYSCLKLNAGREQLPLEVTPLWRLMNQQVMKRGHLRVHLRTFNGKAGRLVHRLVLESWVGPCPDGCTACHNDGNPMNNDLDNLRWDTPKSNTMDRYKHGTMTRLTKDDVIKMRSLRKYGSKHKEIASQFGISRVHSCNVLNGIRLGMWKEELDATGQ